MGWKGKLNQKRKYNEKAEMLEKYKKEPIWNAMERAMKVMKKWYAENNWIFFDKEAMAVLNSMRDDFEKSNAEIERIVEEEKIKAHNELEERFSRIHDKKVLQLQLKSMQKEYQVLQKFAKLKGHGKANNIEIKKARE